MSDFLFGWLCGAGTMAISYCLYRAFWASPVEKVTQPLSSELIDTIVLPRREEPRGGTEAGVVKTTEFAVDKPKHIPWRVRRKELEQMAQTKRRKREQWRDA